MEREKTLHLMKFNGMKRINFLGLFALTIFFNFCSPSTISFYVVDENRINFNSFSFYDRDTKNLRPQQQELDSLIELTISNELIRKGFEKQGSSDVYVGYKVSLGTSSTTSIDRQRYTSPVYYPNNNMSTTHYTEGVLLIEIYSKEEKLLWQGSKAFKVGKSTNTRMHLLKYSEEIISSFKANL